MLKESILAAFFALCLIVSALFAAELWMGSVSREYTPTRLEARDGR